MWGRLLVAAVLLIFPVHSPGQPSERDHPSSPPAAAGAAQGVDQLLRFLGKANSRTANCAAAEAQRNTPTPAFEVRGPSLDPAFWSDPEAAAKTLLLQGKMMIEIGKVLVEQGRAMMASKDNPTIPNISSGSEADQKINAPLRRFLREAPRGEQGETLPVVVRLSDNFDTEIAAKLSNLGFKSSGAVGNLVAGQIPRENILDVARQPFVSAIDLPGNFGINPPRIDAEQTK